MGAEYDPTGKQRLPMSPAIGAAMKVLLHWHKFAEGPFLLLLNER